MASIILQITTFAYFILISQSNPITTTVETTTLQTTTIPLTTTTTPETTTTETTTTTTEATTTTTEATTTTPITTIPETTTTPTTTTPTTTTPTTTTTEAFNCEELANDYIYDECDPYSTTDSCFVCNGNGMNNDFECQVISEFERWLHSWLYNEPIEMTHSCVHTAGPDLA